MNREMSVMLEEQYLAEHPDRARLVEPYVYDDPADAVANGPFPFPLLTPDLLSEDWEKTEQTWFVDSSGFGRPGEPALTADAFRRQLAEYVQEHPEHGFGLTGVGQLQVYVSAFRRVR